MPRLIKPAVRIKGDADLTAWKREALDHGIPLADLFYLKMRQPLSAQTVQQIEQLKQQNKQRSAS